MSKGEPTKEREDRLNRLLLEWAQLNAEAERSPSLTLAGRQMRCSAHAWLLTNLRAYSPSALSTDGHGEACLAPDRTLQGDPAEARYFVATAAPSIESIMQLGTMLGSQDPELAQRAAERWFEWSVSLGTGALDPFHDVQRVHLMGGVDQAAPRWSREQRRQAIEWVWSLLHKPRGSLTERDLSRALSALLHDHEAAQREPFASKLRELAERYSPRAPRRLSQPTLLVRALLHCSAGCDEGLRSRASLAAHRIALLHEALESCTEQAQLQANESSSHDARLQTLHALSADELWRRWNAEQRRQCTERSFELFTELTAPLRAWHEHTSALLEVAGEILGEGSSLDTPGDTSP